MGSNTDACWPNGIWSSTVKNTPLYFDYALSAGSFVPDNCKGVVGCSITYPFSVRCSRFCMVLHSHGAKPCWRVRLWYTVLGLMSV